MSLGCSVSWLPWKKGLDQFSPDHLAEGERELHIFIVGTDFWVCNYILHISQTFTPSLAGFCVCLQWWAVVMKSKRYSSHERSPHWLKIRCLSFLCHIDFAGSSPWSIQGWEHDRTFILVILSSLSPVSCSLILLLMTGLLDGISHSRWKVSLD